MQNILLSRSNQCFKKNDLMKFQMVTNPEGVPAGTELYKINASHRNKGCY